MHLLGQRMIGRVEDEVIELVRETLRQDGQRALGQRVGAGSDIVLGSEGGHAPILRQRARTGRLSQRTARPASPDFILGMATARGR